LAPTLAAALQVYMLALLPGVEGRYALLAGIARGLGASEAVALASLGVATLSAILPPALAWADRLAARLSGGRGLLARLAGVYLSYASRARARASPYMERWGLLGLAAFVAIPLPATGVWTGALAAHLLGVPPRRALPALLLGGLLSEAATLLPALAAA
jgi:uncharacterized membrane protein